MTADSNFTTSESLSELIRSRIENLRPRLLDLSRRNPLISIRLSPKSGSLICVVDELPDVLAFNLGNQRRMRLVPLPPLEDAPRDENAREFQDALSSNRLTDEVYLAAIAQLDPNDEASAEIGRQVERDLRDRIRAELGMAARQKKGDVTIAQHAVNNGILPSYELPSPDDLNKDGRHNDDDIQTLFLPEDLERKLNSLITKCRTWVQETGINVLHVAFGLLEWTDPNSTDIAFAPLTLLPVGIEKVKAHGGAEYWVKANAEDAETNHVLAEKLRLEFGVDLPKFSSGSIEQYLQEVAKVSPKTLKWKVRRQVVVGIFPSARIAMYQDLDTTKHDFGESDILNRLLGGGEFEQSYAVCRRVRHRQS